LTYISYGVLYRLFDLSGNARTNLLDFIISTKQKSFADGKIHNFSLPPDDSYSERFGITFMSLDSDNLEEFKNRLLTLCELRKYKSRGGVWVGLGSLKNSDNMVDMVAFNDKPWEYDEKLENLSKTFLDGTGQFIKLGKKIGRNEKCPCGSGLKYKKCCGK